jgi:cytochrome P450
VAGTYFPGGTTVGISAVPVHLDRQTFGVDAGKYVPERWIEGTVAPDGEPLSPEDMMKYWIPFGIGSRSCIGKNVALLEVSCPRLPLICICGS